MWWSTAMPILRITHRDGGLTLQDSADCTKAALHRALQAEPGPVTVMVHGYKYQPGNPRHCPHDSVLSCAPRRRGAHIIGWPRRLGMRGRAGEGLGIGFGWNARGSIWRAWDGSAAAGRALVGLLDQIAVASPGRAIRLVGHSLGARVCLQAIATAAPGRVARAVLLAPAEFSANTCAALRSPGGRDVEILHVSSRENDLFDAMMEWLVPAPRPGDRMLGFACPGLPGMATLQLDHRPSLVALRGAGFPIADSAVRVCHWSTYLRPGVFPLYRAFLDGRIPVAQLRALLPREPAHRWARFRPTVHGRRLQRTLHNAR
jgi:pimeloyl-ACP methyl ester carboxylesterase